MKLRSDYRAIFRDFIHSRDSFKKKYQNRTIEFWNSTILDWEHDYHYRECKILSDNGFLKFAWGNEGRDWKCIEFYVSNVILREACQFYNIF